MAMGDWLMPCEKNLCLFVLHKSIIFSCYLRLLAVYFQVLLLNVLFSLLEVLLKLQAMGRNTFNVL